jgi:UDP-N-acetylglucosamine 3-dehydrogenase
MEVINVGVIGAGSMGENHARIYSELSNVELIGLADVNKKAKEIAKKYSTQYYQDYKDLLRKIDAVSIATPTALHYKLCMDFLSSGIHVLVEKPIAETIQQGEDLVKKSEESDIILQVGHIERFNPAVIQLRTILQHIKPVIFETHRLGPFIQRASKVGVVVDLMIHDIDVLRFILGSEPKCVFATGGKVNNIQSKNEDYAFAVLKFEEITALLSANRITQTKIRTLKVFVPDAFITLDYLNQDILIFKKGFPQDYVQDNIMGYRQEYIIEKPFIPKKEPLKVELDNFIKSISGKEEPLSPGIEGLNSLRATYTVIKNMYSGERIKYA